MATLDREKYASASMSSKGGYILSDCEGTPDTILMGSGSELGLCVEAANALTADGMKVRVVSMPCLDLFADQSIEYQQEVLPREVTNRVAVEAGLRMSWDRWLGLDGKFIGMHGYGASGPYGEVYKHFNITAEAVAAAAKV
jgi:transketolase